MSAKDTRLFVIAAPSGAGKTTLVHATVLNSAHLRFSISYTTRPQRSNEVDGKDYFFVSEDHFERMRKNGELL
jgi:guanylate kinase